MHLPFLLATGFTAVCVLCNIVQAGDGGSAPYWAYVAGKDAISLFRLNPATTALESQGNAVQTGAGFLVFSPDERFLYATADTLDATHKRMGAVVAFSVDRATGHLTVINRQPSGGDSPCFVTIDPLGKHVLVANYGSATVAVFPVAADGTLGPADCIIQQTGSSIDPARQKHAFAHSVNLDPSGRFAFVADLGADKLFIYRFDSATGKLTPNDSPALTVPPGSGPRHLSFDPAGRFAYLVNEMGSTVISYSFDAAHGSLQELQQISTLPADFKGTNTCAEVLVHPSGKFLYASNRGDSNSITAYSIDPSNGKLAWIENKSTLGKTPRNFRIDPTGTFLVAANQDSNSVVLFSIDQQTGKLTARGTPLPTGTKPICVKFLKIAAP